jgi:type I restriction enzyme S subunit
MEIREGYKQTEIGVIPEDWNITSLREVSDIKTGPFGSALHAKDYVDLGTPIITVEHLGEYSIEHKNLPLVSNNDKKRLSTYVLQVNDIVFSRVGSVDRNARVTNNEDGWLFSGRLLRIRPNKNRVNSGYLSHHFHYEPVKQLIRNIAVGQTMSSLNTKLLSLFKVVIPPLAEQQAIATALSDIDGLINSLQKLIDKKKKIKQGAMQELLTGKRRLEGSGEWIDLKLSELGCFVSGNGFPIKYQGSQKNQYPFYKVSDFNNYGNEIYMSKANNYISEEVRETLSVKIIPKNAIIFAKIGAAIFLERKRIASMECCIDNNMMCFISNSSVLCGKFAYYIFQNIKLGNLVSATALPSLSSKDIGEVLIYIPSNIEEQTAIANILSDMDSEIEALERKLNKYKDIKQGMMQELLTGRIRLLEEAVP